MAQPAQQEKPNMVHKSISIALHNLVYAIWFLMLVFFSVMGGGLKRVQQSAGESGTNALLDQPQFQTFLNGGADTLLISSFIVYLIITGYQIYRFTQENR